MLEFQYSGPLDNGYLDLEIVLITEACTSCKVCKDICPADMYEFDSQDKIKFKPGENGCIYFKCECEACKDACPHGVIVISCVYLQN